MKKSLLVSLLNGLKFLLLFPVVALLNFNLMAQQDTTFWFVAPEVDASHGDEPIVVRMVTLDQQASVTVTQPAAATFPVYNTTIPPYSMGTITLTPSKAQIENTPFGTVNTKGLMVSSTAPVSAYYEVAHSNNPDIFPLKGRTALGTVFYIPSQDAYPNQSGGNRRESFEIVATENNTTVTITVTADVTNHVAGSTFSIVLNRGETYSCRTLSPNVAVSLKGSKVIADKPVAVTIADDSVLPGSAGGGYDLIGDQLLPVNLVGVEYIVVKGFAYGSSNYERAFILATANNTTVSIDGVPIATTLSAGQQYALTLVNNSYYITASNPVYVYHISGHNTELGSSIIPHITCTGSAEIGFNRQSNGDFAMMVLTKTAHTSNFTIDGNATLLTASDFAVVPGTGGVWSCARKEFNSISVLATGAHRIVNTSGVFHLGILNNLGGSSEYGYFSNYTSLFIGADVSICPESNITLDAGPDRLSYLWSTGATSQTISVSTPGTYWVEVDDEDCPNLSDTIEVATFPPFPVSIGPDTAICQGQVRLLDPGPGYKDVLWQDGSTNPTYNANTTGQYWVRVFDENLCPTRDTMNLIVHPLPNATFIKHN
ncbi:MAG: IgGFc-binding protein [Bacteroidales bacterium]|nr:IgGFc-binding protein [Bacteroidales bacterium]